MFPTASHYERVACGAVARLALAAVAALALLAAVPGCEYFTSEKLANLAPGGKAVDPASKLGPDPLATGMPSAVAVNDPATGEPSRLSAAEIVAMMERIVRGNQLELDVLAPKLDEREEAEQAADVFQHLDDLVKSLEREKKKAKEEGEVARLAELERQAKSLEKPWVLARERLNLDLRARMLMLERVQILKDVLAHDRERLDAVLATGDMARFLDESRAATAREVEKVKAATEKDAPAPAAVEKAKADEPPTVQIPIVPGQPLIPKTVEPKEAPKAEGDAAKAKPADAAAEPAKADAQAKEGAEKSDAAAKTVAPPSKELVSAKQDLRAKGTTVQKLQERTMSLEARMQNLVRSLELVQELVRVSRECVENATQAREFLLSEMQDGKPSAAAQAWTHDGADALGALDRRVREASDDVKRLTARFDEMVEERTVVEDALKRTNLRVETAKAGLEQTQEKVEALESPFSSHNIKAWLRANGPAIVATLVVMSLLYLIVSRYAQKVVELFAARGMRGSKAERDNRMETLVSVLQNTGSVVVILGGGSTLLSQVGIPVAPLLGGAAVAGVAVAFGAQNLIKDFFYGFMILLENQYKLKDVVKIGDHSGQVEQITLRMTALRDGDGGLHFLPNGATTSVINLTHGWSSASFSVRVSWEEDVDRVIAIIQDLGKEIRQDPSLRLMIVDDLSMMGVDSLTDTAVVIMFSIKTLPLQQWNVKREFLKRLKKRFQEKNVILPPQPLGPTP